MSGSSGLSFFLGDSDKDDFLECLALAFFSGERDNGLLVLRLGVGR